MNIEYLFRRLVFTQVLLGIVAFCMAERNPQMLLVAGSLGALSWYISEGPTGRPLPQWVINFGAAVAVLWLGVEMAVQKDRVIVAMGHFTMWLQILQLYGYKSNREYGLILVLSLLQVVGASILSVSMIFGVLLLVYSTLSLFTVLIFQFKATSDEVKNAKKKAAPCGQDVMSIKAVVCRGYRFQFRLMASVFVVIAGMTAVVLFITLPRTSRFSDQHAGLFSRPQVGFTNQVRLGAGTPGEGSNTPVMNIKTSHRVPFLLLRGAALDHYDVHMKTWVRGNRTLLSAGLQIDMPEEGYRFDTYEEDAEMFSAEITMRNPRRSELFGLLPTCRIDSPSVHRLLVNPVDQQLLVPDMPHAVVIYRIESPLDFVQAQSARKTTPPRLARGGTEFGLGMGFDVGTGALFGSELESNALPPDDPQLHADADAQNGIGGRSQAFVRWLFGAEFGQSRYGEKMSRYALGWRVEPEVLRRYALNVLRDHYTDPNLDRLVTAVHDPRDFSFTQVLEAHLQDEFAYSLENVSYGPGDPILAFLLTRRQGHCEFFASALAALTRSLGMRARVVTGYRVGEYNSIGDYYIVRERNAHAWTEVDCGYFGWQTFDATPRSEVEAEHVAEDDWLAGARQMYEHLEFLWIDAFVAYDKETREATLNTIEKKFSDASSDKNHLLGKVVRWFDALGERWRFDQFNFSLAAVALLFIGVGVFSLMRMAVAYRKRVAALQLSGLPRQQRKQLVKRLQFYLSMIGLLERYGYHRPIWKCPMDYAKALHERDHTRFNPVLQLTEVFYEVRFGQLPLDEDRLGRVRMSLKQLERTLASKSAVSEA